MRIVSKELHDKRSAAGRKGGYVTFLKYGREQMRDWGKAGGRPRAKTLSELLAEKGKSNIERGNGVPSLIVAPRSSGCRKPARVVAGRY